MQLKDPIKAERRRQKKAEAARLWRQNNPELAKQKARERYKADPEVRRRAVQKWREKHPEECALIQRASTLKRKFGISLEEYESLLESQGGVCSICFSKDPKTKTRSGVSPNFAVDHDHSTGAVRGLLCGFCNSGLGFFQDDKERLRAAISYLSHHGR